MLQSIMWLHYILSSSSFSFFEKTFLCLSIKSFDTIFGYFTHTHTVMNRLYNQAFVELKTVMQCVILFQFLYGYY